MASTSVETLFFQSVVAAEKKVTMSLGGLVFVQPASHVVVSSSKVRWLDHRVRRKAASECGGLREESN